MKFKFNSLLLIWLLAFVACHTADPKAAARKKPTESWIVGTPIVTYWAGPPMTDATAQQMADGGWNMVWCTEKELDVAHRHGLRAQLHDGLLAPESLEQPSQREKLDALITRVKTHPALYSYFITDEPTATNFPGLGKLVSYLRAKDPAHLAYINLFPTYANNDQLGTKGDKVTAYKKHLDQYVDIVKPDLISYDHYQFAVKGDTPDYFLNLSMIQHAAQEAKVPFLNIVQAATWSASMRVPKPDEMRYLVYTTMAYGAQGISYYVYSAGGHTGMIARADGTPTELYDVLKTLNREFVAITSELQRSQCLGVYHAGMAPLPPGTEPLPVDSPLKFDPPLAVTDYKSPQPVKGVLIGFFGPAPNGKKPGPPTHAIIVNLDYNAERELHLIGPRQIELFEPATGKWSRTSSKRIELHLSQGGGKLVRIRK
jgi:hypothetical protein